jgi:hypothetical protein
MRRLIFASFVVLGSLGLETAAEAQWAYPGNYGRYGYSPYGMDPGAGYMAGLGAYARGRGAYLVDEANARSINTDTMLDGTTRFVLDKLRSRPSKTSKKRRTTLTGKLGRRSATSRTARSSTIC